MRVGFWWGAVCGACRYRENAQEVPPKLSSSLPALSCSHVCLLSLLDPSFIRASVKHCHFEGTIKMKDHGGAGGQRYWCGNLSSIEQHFSCVTLMQSANPTGSHKRKQQVRRSPLRGRHEFRTRHTRPRKWDFGLQNVTGVASQQTTTKSTLVLEKEASVSLPVAALRLDALTTNSCRIRAVCGTRRVNPEQHKSCPIAHASVSSFNVGCTSIARLFPTVHRVIFAFLISLDLYS